MHIDRNAMELLAQVIPALLIVLVLEGRLPKPEGRPTFWRWVHAMFRNFTVFMSLAAEGICLFLIMGNGETGTFTDVFIVVSVLFLLLAVYLMLIRLIGSELSDNIWRRSQE
jgi:hypothetical protein